MPVEDTCGPRLASASANYDRHYSTFAGQPGYEREARYALTLLELLRRNGLPVSERASLLDLGCGLGFKTRALAPRFQTACGVDLSPTAIEAANRLNDLPNLRFMVLDVESQRLDQRFDVVTAFGLSLLNASDEVEYAERLTALAGRFASGGKLVVVSGSYFSGAFDEGGWFNHSHRMLRRIQRLANAIAPTRLYFPSRDPRSYLTFGAEHALTELAKPFLGRRLGRRRDYCFIVDGPERR